MSGIESRFICKSTEWIILLEDVDLGKTAQLPDRDCHFALATYCSGSSSPQDLHGRLQHCKVSNVLTFVV